MIPYAAPGQSIQIDQELWQHDRDSYLAKLSSSTDLTEDEKRRLDTLRRMSYDDFLKVYMQDASPEDITPYGGQVGVGHVAIVNKIADEPPTIVEALWGVGVREISYDAWKAERQGGVFWHGRLKEVDPELRAEVAKLAEREVGKPYDFWNFDLADESGFYCSKLAWLMIRNATGVVVDDNPNPVRKLWFSPKQLLKSPHLNILQNPGSYGLPKSANEN